jgi:sorting nexin-29
VEGIRSLLRRAGEIQLFSTDVILLTESLAKDATAPLLPDYYMFDTPRSESSRGLAIGTRTPATCLAKGDHYLAVETLGVIFMVAYFVPNTPMDEILMIISGALASLDPNKPMILGGDFNCRIDTGRRGTDLSEQLYQYGFSLINERLQPTYVAPTGSSTIDLMFYRGKQQIKPTHTSIHPHELRKHLQVIVSWEIKEVVTATRRDPRLPRKIDQRTLEEHLIDIKTRHALEPEPDDPDSVYDGIMRSLTAACVSTKRVQHHKPWFDGECRRLKTSLLVAYSLKDRSPEDLQRHRTLKRQFAQLLNRKRNMYEEAALLQKLQNAEITPWSLFDDRPRSTPAQIQLEVLEQHFSDLLDPNGPPDIPEADDQREVPDWCNEPFSEDEVRQAITRTKDKKATGPDRLAYEHLKASLPPFLTVWVTLFNICLRTSKIPEIWRQSYLKILYKGKGDTTSPDSYRGLALLCNPLKILTSIINKRLIAHLQFPESQHGFRPGRSTRTPLRELLHEARHHLSEGNSLYALFVDFKKAFDSVDRSRLFTKVQDQFGVRGCIARLIRGLLKGSTFRIDDGITLSRPVHQHRGVAQGDSLSPTLFLMFIADLSTKLEAVANIKFSFYADDLVIYSTDFNCIQFALDALSEWSIENGIDVNASKTKVMKFRRGGRVQRDLRFEYQGQEIQIVNRYVYLGITLQPTLTFTEHLERKKNQALSAVGCLRHLQRLSLTTAVKIFDMKIRPILEYGLVEISPFLTLPQLVNLDRVKCAFLKKALGLPKNASNTLVLRMCEQRSLVEDLVSRLTIDPDVWVSYADQRRDKSARIDNGGFNGGPAFTQQRWKEANQKDRHVITRTTVHGFHHKICTTDLYHDPVESCRCKLCNGNAGDRYHILGCASRLTSLCKFVHQLES